MTDIQRLTLIGEALYGRTWQAQVCDLLQVDNRRVAHWLAGTRPIPNGIWAELNTELVRRGRAALVLAGQVPASGTNLTQTKVTA